MTSYSRRRTQAFAALPPAQFDALKANPAALTDFDCYDVFLGMLETKDVKDSGRPQCPIKVAVETPTSP